MCAELMEMSRSAPATSPIAAITCIAICNAGPLRPASMS